MPDNPLLRRLITIPTVVVMFALVTVLAPLWLTVGSLLDLTRSLRSGTPWMTIRGFVFLWIYLLGQMWALGCILATAPLTRMAKERATVSLQGLWTRWNLAALRGVFSLVLKVEGQDCVLPGPIVVLSRHVSMVDTILPARLIANPFGLRLRYVLKKELLVDPVLDIGGHRLPNHFIDRRSGESLAEIEALKRLATGLGTDEGVLVFPEGTRFTAEKHRRLVARAAGQDGVIGELAAGYRAVLPPRPGGTLALLESSGADVVILAHRGLEGLATARDIWSGGMVGSKVEVALWRIADDQIPGGARERREWLFRTWAAVDEWVTASTSRNGEVPV
ncbi:MAG TPA: lysophospholipid acyltransferase family protein [Acidimicrobiia bacterium]